MIKVREETPEDFEAVRRVNESAFARPREASLVESLRPAVVKYHPEFGKAT